jgi:hypothetical protein
MNYNFATAALFTIGTCWAHVGVAQESTPWRLYAEAGPKINVFDLTSSGASATYPKPGYNFAADVAPEIDKTFSSFASLKAFKPLTRHLVFSGTVGLDMQHLDVRTGLQETGATGAATRYERAHISRLLARARVDWGLHYQVKINETAHLLPGVSVGQMVNLSKNGYSYTFLQPGLYFTTNRLLLSLTASTTPYKVRIPGVSTFSSTYNAEQVTADFEFTVYDVQLGIGAKF